jgi:hypothetical protein
MLTFIVWILLAALIGFYAKKRGYLPDWFVFFSLTMSPVVPLALLLCLGDYQETDHA